MIERDPTAGAASTCTSDLSTIRQTILDFLMDFSAEVIAILRDLQTAISGNMLPLVKSCDTEFVMPANLA
jgi:hypothetical protein